VQSAGDDLDSVNESSRALHYLDIKPDLTQEPDHPLQLWIS
jgi:hypothetical protein